MAWRADGPSTSLTSSVSDGWVTEESYPTLEADNFLGLATARIASPELLVSDLESYTPRMGVVNRDLVMQHHGAGDQVALLLQSMSSCWGSSATGRQPGGEERPGAPLARALPAHLDELVLGAPGDLAACTPSGARRAPATIGAGARAGALELGELRSKPAAAQSEESQSI